MLGVKIGIVMMVISIAFAMFRHVGYGRQRAQARSSDAQVYALGNHQSSFWCLTSQFVIAITLIMFLRTHSSSTDIDPLLLGIHLASVACFVPLFVGMGIRFNGLRYPKLHATLAYYCVAAFVCMALSGSFLLYYA